MHCIPHNVYEILEFDKVLGRLQGYCTGPTAAAICPGINPETHIDWIRYELQCALEAQRILESGQTFLSHSYADLENILRSLSVPGYILESQEILEIYRLLDLVAEVRTFFNDEQTESYPKLGAIAGRMHDPATVLSAILRILDESGQVKPDASRELLRISREIQNVSHQCDVEFQKLVRHYASKDWLAETLESIRNERRVLAVKVEHKRQIRGILHDHSASGKTVLIEPEEVIGINNDLFDLRAQYKAEIRNLLRALCDRLRSHIDSIQEGQNHITELDLHLAKGRLGRAMNAHVPVLDASPRLSIRKAHHPLLLLKNISLGKKTVPFDLDLHPPNRILLLSGPNAGGKSILMKAVGLLQLMVQSGIPVPVSPDSVFGIFGQISASLGDHQSIENDLSTYSSKLIEMKECLEYAGEQSLVLIDEFGSGTDPRLGGAIAEGILEALCAKHAFAVITTHYSELKVYAYKKRGIVNGAMVFDKEHLVPTYELVVGKPGSSFTFEIARKSGLPEEILTYAARKTGQNLRDMEELLADLDQQKKKLDNSVRQAEARSQQLDQLIQSYERMQNDLTAQRHRMRLEQKEKDYAHLSQLNRELEKSIRSIREEKDIAAAKEKLKEVKTVQSATRAAIGEINTSIKAYHPGTNKIFQPGDFVRVHNSTQTGKIERISKQKATLIIGNMRLDVPVSELLPARDPLDIRSEKSTPRDIEVQERFDTRLDLRGMRPEEATDILERFMDMALVSNAHSVQIIHGKGTGALKKLVQDKLREYPIKQITQPVDQQGGSGMTVVEL
jgi:DNA mismatch repair protein MutS2